MRIRRLTNVLFFIGAILLLIPQISVADTTYLFGKIGTFPVGAFIERNGNSLSGWYFYKSQARLIRLEGDIDSKGAFRIRELTNYKETGIFGGSAGKGRWTGTWRKNADSKPLPFYFEENRSQVRSITGQYECAASERDAKFGYTYRWELKLSMAGGAVTKLASTQGSHGDRGEEQYCSIDLKDLQPIPSESGMLLQFRDDDSGGDGTKCRVRILGDADTLWVRFGDSSDPNECRYAGSTMLCSPRAFWNDIILDRKTKKCRALK
jgi:hypothetical protein